MTVDPAVARASAAVAITTRGRYVGHTTLIVGD
jgi:hypothetical protein